MEPMTPEQIKRLLQRYYDIPQMIDEELATIRHCQEERGKFSLASPNLSGMPTGKGSTGDPTAAQAMRDSGAYFDRQIAVCQKRIATLKKALTEFVQAGRYTCELCGADCIYAGLDVADEMTQCDCFKLRNDLAGRKG